MASLDLSLALPQDDVDHPAEDSQREGHPGQDVGKAEGDAVCGRMPLRVSHCEDGRAAHHAQASKDLENTSKVESSTFSECEELAEEQEQRYNTEDDRKYHQSLDRLQPFIRR